MRKIGIDNTCLYDKEVSQKNAKGIQCPLSFNGDGVSLCVTTCAWFRIEEKYGKGNNKDKLVTRLAFCGDKLIGEIVDK